MKRKPKTNSDSSSTKKYPRQDPVSCESCRKKKLKCNRSIPCSSCIVRNIDCSFGSRLTASASSAVKQGSQTGVSQPYNQGESRPQHPTPDVEPRSRNRDDPLMTVDWLETMVMGHRVPSAIPPPLRDELSQHSRAAVAEGISNLGALSFSSGSGHTPSCENPAKIRLSCFLPPKAEALDLFQFYINHLDYQYHIIIPSYTRRDIEDIYDSSRTDDLNLPHVALLFAIVAAALFYKLLSTESAGISEASSCEMAFLAGAALIQSDYVACPTVEGLQAAMIIGHNSSIATLNPAVSSLFLHGSLISQAKTLGLHMVDSSISEPKINGNDRTKVELKRRLWWDLASYDWFLGFLSGPQEWTYTISPRQMNVRRPWNIEDEDIETSETELPITEPTCMSYTLQRLRLAEVCREIVDSTAFENLQGMEIPYDKILSLDRKLQDAYAEIPAFFRFDQSSQYRFASLYRERPVVAWQRSLLQQGYHYRFCRLHRQYLVRGAKDPKYSYSHIVSLQSARKVLEVKRIMDEEDPIFAPNSSLFWAVMHHVFMAAVILLIDVCFNWDDILAEKRKEEVLAACRLLCQAQQSSSIVRGGIDAMMEILRKHWKKERRQCPLADSLNEKVGQAHLQISYASKDTQIEVPEQDLSIASDFGQIPLEDLWSGMLDRNEDIGLGTPDWKDLLMELTNATLPPEL
ncbi:transcriptional regulator family: Fungal Specific TF [Penicillium taxi]|uniref:transcriptional regulator family: Fungal Specific TF n=1 Tax=Penicillium taxi TaxID=168475 RepID=UPI002545900B|nr:transcriptional regulator family: Fungal Specific TF [Penicillium taxi]KAJ5894610.1 transcriptional regulator family: Fungal Specific TF [Penicillium taxi]